jgi:hypothetical protein
MSSVKSWSELLVLVAERRPPPNLETLSKDVDVGMLLHGSSS